MRLTITAVSILILATVAQAQDKTPSEAPPAGASPAAAAPDGGKRDACKKEIKAKGLRGGERTDAMQICMAEGRLDCVKDAVAKKIAVSDRKKFIESCLGKTAKGGDDR